MKFEWFAPSESLTKEQQEARQEKMDAATNIATNVVVMVAAASLAYTAFFAASAAIAVILIVLVTSYCALVFLPEMWRDLKSIFKRSAKAEVSAAPDADIPDAPQATEA